MKDLFGSMDAWNFDNISFVIPKSIMDLILSIPKINTANKPNRIRRHLSPNSEFYRSCIYDTLLGP